MNAMKFVHLNGVKKSRGKHYMLLNVLNNLFFGFHAAAYGHIYPTNFFKFVNNLNLLTLLYGRKGFCVVSSRMV